MKKPRPLFEVVDWEDSTGPRGWATIAQIDTAPMRIRSAGWVIDETAASITLAGHLGDADEDAYAPLSIPKRAILKRRRVHDRAVR